MSEDDGAIRHLGMLSTRSSLLRRLHGAPTNAAAWSELVRCYGPPIYQWCQRWKVQPADAADITQEVLVRLVRRLPAFCYDERGSFRAYLKSLVYYSWCDFLQERRDPAARAGSGGLQVLAGVEARADLERRLEEEFDREVLAEAMTRVAQRVATHTWEAFRLQTVEGVVPEQVALRLGMKIASVYKARSNVIRLLKATVLALEGADSPHDEVADEGLS